MVTSLEDADIAKPYAFQLQQGDDILALACQSDEEKQQVNTYPVMCLIIYVGYPSYFYMIIAIPYCCVVDSHHRISHGYSQYGSSSKSHSIPVFDK